MVARRSGTRTGIRLLPAAAALLLLSTVRGTGGEQDLLQALQRPGPQLPQLPQLPRLPQLAPARAPLDLSQSTDELEMAAALLLRGYQVLLSSQDGPRCQFTPSCSEYARIVIRRHGLLAGLLMASDRYQRCNGLQVERYPLDRRTGKRLDPPPETQAGSGPP